MPVPYTFAGASATIPLSDLDANFTYFTNAITVSSNNVGINSSTPVAKLASRTDGVAIAAQMETASQSVQIGVYNASAVKVAAIVNYGGSYTGGSILNVGASGTTFIQEANAPLGICTFGVAQPLILGTNSLERMRIDSNGNVAVGSTAQVVSGRSGIQFDQASHWGLAVKNSSATATGSMIVFVNSTNGTSGSIVQSNSTTIAYNTSSDYRLKQNIEPMTGAIDKITALKPVTYTWKESGGAGQGFIAHELQEVVPECVTGTKDAVDKDGKPSYQGVDTSFLVATLVAAIKEQQAIITDMQARLVALEA